MSLRLRIALGFAGVALATAAVISIVASPIVGRGFAQLESDTAGQTTATAGGGSGQGRGNGAGPGPQAGLHAAEIQQDTVLALIAAALAAAVAASLLGFVAAGWMSRPLSQLAQASRAVASGDLARRSGLGERTDEFGEVGRSFDAMTADLQRAEEQRRRFIQDAVHELRTPLTVIDGTAGAIEEGIFEPEPRLLRTIREQTQVLSRIVDDLRTINLAEGGELPLELNRVAIREVAEGAVDAFRARATADEITLSAEVDPGCVVDADAGRLSQILAALIDNALRHTPTAGTVGIVGRSVGAKVRVAVEDTGSGIADEDMPRVFDRLYQADPSRDRRTGSSGLGLSIVRALVEAHGGRVGAENRSAAGASFWFELPKAQDSSTRPR